MAISTLDERKRSADQPSLDRPSLGPLAEADRLVGVEASTEIAELVGAIVKHGGQLSGLARHGMLMRIKSLAHLMEGLLDGSVEPAIVRLEVYGTFPPRVSAEGVHHG